MLYIITDKPWIYHFVTPQKLSVIWRLLIRILATVNFDIFHVRYPLQLIHSKFALNHSSAILCKMQTLQSASSPIPHPSPPTKIVHIRNDLKRVCVTFHLITSFNWFIYDIMKSFYRYPCFVYGGLDSYLLNIFTFIVYFIHIIDS